MNPEHIIPLLQAEMEEGYLLSVIRFADDESRVIHLTGFTGEIANCIYTRVSDALGIEMLKCWEDVNSWRSVVIQCKHTEDELRIKLKAEHANQRGHHNHPFGELLSRLGAVEVKIEDGGDGTPPSRTN